jgi:hypothetical protein
MTELEENGDDEESQTISETRRAQSTTEHMKKEEAATVTAEEEEEQPQQHMNNIVEEQPPPPPPPPTPPPQQQQQQEQQQKQAVEMISSSSIVYEKRMRRKSNKIADDMEYQQQQQLMEDVDEQELLESSFDDMVCSICNENITNKWHSVWITPQNVKHYKCFKELGYDGTAMGRACRSCYNRYFSYIHAKKYSNMVCICCSKQLSKRSYPFSSFADVYRSLFPNIDPNATEGRVCTTCYDKGYNARQGSSKPFFSSGRRGRPPASSNSSKKSRRLSNASTSTNSSSNSTAVAVTADADLEMEEEYEEEEQEPSNDTEVQQPIPKKHRRVIRSNREQKIPVEFYIMISNCARHCKVEYFIQKNIIFSDLKKLVLELAKCIAENIGINTPVEDGSLMLIENDRTGTELEVHVDERFIRAFPLQSNSKIKVYCPSLVNISK